MDRYTPKEIIDEVNNIDVLRNPELHDFAPNDVEGLRDSEHVEVREPNGFYDLIEIDRLNKIYVSVLMTAMLLIFTEQ